MHEKAFQEIDMKNEYITIFIFGLTRMKIWTPFKRIAAPHDPDLDSLLEKQYSIGFADGFVSASLLAAFIVTAAILSVKK